MLICRLANLVGGLLMHDWTFEACEVVWATGIARLQFLDRSSQKREIAASGLVGLKLPREEPWGPSTSVLSCSKPVIGTNGVGRLVVELQSGDIVEVEARHFDFPANAEFV
jgi:hypothetical protein